MKSRVMVVDQTLDEALRLGVSISALKGMDVFFNKYSIEMADVSFGHLQRYGVSVEQTLLLPLLRCKVSPSLLEIAQVRQMGFSKVIISWFHNARKPLLEPLIRAIVSAQEFAQEVYLCIENASELSTFDLSSYWPIVKGYQIKRVIYQDQGRRIDPLLLYKKLEQLQALVPCPLEFHGHNAYGLAVANSLAALRAGVVYVATSIGGIGLPNHAPMEEVLMSVKHLWKQSQVPSGNSLAKDCVGILSRIGINLPVDKALIGRDVFAHESGIHVDGITKNPALYEVIRPEEVGQIRQLVIGKHSGTASLKIKFLQWNLEIDQAEAIQMLEKVRRIASLQKSPLSDLQLHQLYWRRQDIGKSQLG